MGAAAVLLTGYVLVVAVLSGSGLVLTRLLLDGPVGRADASATAWLAEHRTDWLNELTRTVSRTADTLGIIGVALVVVVVLATRRHWRWIAILVTALATELVCFLAVNHIVDRPRPDVARLGLEPSTSSFPSGHTAATLVLYACVALFVTIASRSTLAKVLAWTLAVVMPSAVAFARVDRGMHHPLDVLAGLIVGGLVLVVVFAASAVWSHPSTGDSAVATGERI